MPFISEAQRRAFWAAASGKSNLGISEKVAKRMTEEDPGGKLPAKAKDMTREGWRKIYEGLSSIARFFGEEEREPEHGGEDAVPPKGRAASVAFVTPDGRVLMTRRSRDEKNYPGYWALPGGQVEDGEEFAEAAKRECGEEIGDCTFDGMAELRRARTPGGFDHVTYTVPVKEAFEPKLNHEHDAFDWVPVTNLPEKTHPGVRAAIDEGLERAQAAWIAREHGKIPSEAEDAWTDAARAAALAARRAKSAHSKESHLEASNAHKHSSNEHQEEAKIRGENLGKPGKGSHAEASSHHGSASFYHGRASETFGTPDYESYAKQANRASGLANSASEKIRKVGEEYNAPKQNTWEPEHKTAQQHSAERILRHMKGTRFGSRPKNIRDGLDEHNPEFSWYSKIITTDRGRRVMDRLQKDMAPEEFQELRDLLDEFFEEEEQEPEHREGDGIILDQSAIDPDRHIYGKTAQDRLAHDYIGAWLWGMAADRAPATARTIDDSGHMHVKGSVLTKAVVSPYLGSEINSVMAGEPGWGPLEPDKKYYLLRDPNELKKAVATFNGLPLLWRHQAATADDHPADIVIGSTGSSAKFEDPDLTNDLSIWPAYATKAVEDGSKKSLSCGYGYKAVMEPGVYEGQRFDGRMVNIKGNHVALVDAPRVPGAAVAGDSVDEFLWHQLASAIRALA